MATRDDSRFGQHWDANYGNLDTYEALTGVHPAIFSTCNTEASYVRRPLPARAAVYRH